MSKTYPHINLIGVELEGAWGNRLFEDAEIHEDISVPIPALPGHYGEIASQPLLPEEVEKWVLKHYPLEIPMPADGKSCGLHMHLSLDTQLDYCRVLSMGFFKHFLMEITDWGERTINRNSIDYVLFSQRVEGRNRFARRLHVPSRQVSLKKKDSGVNADRRTLLNYCHGLHGTVEVRLFPMFLEPAITVSAILTTIKIFSDYLIQQEGVEERKISHALYVGEVKKK